MSRDDTSLTGDDSVALRDLVNRYAALVDDRDPAGVAALFTDDGVLTTAGPPQSLEPTHRHRGTEEIRQALAGLDQLLVTFHAVTGELFDAGPDPDTATGRVSCLAHHISERDGALRDVTWAVTYRDSYRRTPSGWRFAERSAWVAFLSTSPVKLARDTRGDGNTDGSARAAEGTADPAGDTSGRDRR
ncbi:nuclear transport factor 2 family protein [Nocardioides sp. AE5]|uniref:nuclear transport factor 2 family protein n=1 Tax=Nocardioides sp. AE5 TaxID=2962573 RepID=UPI002882104F|nr:nuclear transport factor 2 family protein [Nocardioides sp. AE5]MDT0203215.1 nuclear transport factor 2 family protein [Nocardioides sp. AE5]